MITMILLREGRVNNYYMTAKFHDHDKAEIVAVWLMNKSCPKQPHPDGHFTTRKMGKDHKVVGFTVVFPHGASKDIDVVNPKSIFSYQPQ